MNADGAPARPAQPPGHDTSQPQRRAELLVAEMEARLRRVEQGLDDLHAAVSADVAAAAGPTAPPGPAAATSAGPPPRHYHTLEQFVQERFVLMYGRVLGTGSGARWCRRWWRHAEAISRLEAVWRSWESLRLDRDMGIAVWYRDFLDPQLAVLFSPAGPFARCTADRHEDDHPLPFDRPPPGYWKPPPAPAPVGGPASAPPVGGAAGA